MLEKDGLSKKRQLGLTVTSRTSAGAAICVWHTPIRRGWESGNMSKVILTMFTAGPSVLEHN